MTLDTHGIIIPFGKHKGELLTRIPISYIRWMINQNDYIPLKKYAEAEFIRRGDTMPLVELSGHAIDHASLRVRKIWHETKLKGEGLYSWLQRMTLQALDDGDSVEIQDDNTKKIKYKGMKFIITEGEEFPILKTIMRS